MARYTGPVCRLCRREGMKLFLKGDKCASEKCTFNKRDFIPGQHSKSRIKLSDYGLQLREKQKVKRMYGILEKQFRLYFKMAEKSKGITGATLLQLLERRLDNVVFQSGFAASRAQARQMVRHRHVAVGGRIVNIPSYLVQKDNLMQIKCSEEKLKRIKDISASRTAAIPSWLKVDGDNLIAAVTRLPERIDIKIPIQEQLIVELYSK